ncbi:hypothetical protein HN51_048019 [Arachis hypogaea]|uniref:Uncharacterized protein n=1 Tax=Arachis hypogaea TaxID=3818 RepID=A0A445AJ94_ARAHY|nr:UPF0161 protein At3g09310 [Arachis ipaensis]XP_025633457.1 UPF0161 protein At3g09310 [Arachis hypogaea]QHO24471.1 UPF0161 protein [Arachis hypogaea]QHO24472.1 UPF0161 protein [Arachis hypogaea]QHO24473.1 UPF0161 protein [Arachis hypogaea]RYR26482.1 hypothetical protein Ahy_B02g060725 [Arachis hypogaea]
MACVVYLPVPLNFHSDNTPTRLQLRNPNPNSLRIEATNRHALILRLPSSSRAPRHNCTPTVRAFDEQDSNSETETLPDAAVNNLGVKAALSMLRFYKREISPILPKSCRYIPTCSEYSMEAYKRYGVVKGTVLTAWRLCRCNPLGGHGYDPPRWFGETSPREELDD